MDPTTLRTPRTLRIRLAAGALIVGFTALAAGCASTDAQGPDAAASEKPEAPSICLISEGSSSPTLDIAVRRAFADRGYQVRLVEAKDARVKTCRFVFNLTSGVARNPSEHPDFIALEYRDAYTGESKRVRWKKTGTAGGAFVRARSYGNELGTERRPVEAGNALLTGFYDDPDRIVRGLVDRVLPPFDARVFKKSGR